MSSRHGVTKATVQQLALSLASYLLASLEVRPVLSRMAAYPYTRLQNALLFFPATRKNRQLRERAKDFSCRENRNFEPLLDK